MLFYLIRHGEPNYDLDTLTPRGFEQAEALAGRMALHGLDRIYASPLGRAQDTARPTAKLLGLPIEIEPWSSEELAWADFAVLDENGKHQWAFFCQNTKIRNEKTRNLTMDNWYTAEPYAHIHGKEGFERIRAGADDFFARQGYVREGESYRQVRPNEDRVALFCHQGFSMALLPILLQVPPQFTFGSFDFSHTGVTIFEFRNNPDGWTQPRCLCLSDLSHLFAAGLPMKYHGKLDI